DYLEDIDNRQDINEYKIVSFSQDEKTYSSVAYEKAENSKFIDAIMGYDKLPLSERSGFQDYAQDVAVSTFVFQHQDKSMFPQDEHYITLAIAMRRKRLHLLAPEESELLEVAKRRMNILSTNSNVKTIVTDKLDRAKKKVGQISNNDPLFITYQEKIN